MTDSELKSGLTDPNYGVGYIIGNNPQPIAERLRDMGFVVSTPDDIAQALNALLQRGDGALFIQALSVPMMLDETDPAEAVIVADTARAMRRMAGAKSLGDATAEDWFGGLAAGYLAVLQSTGASVDPQTTTAVAPQATKPDNTLMYVLGAVGAVLIIVLVVMAVKAAKKAA